MIGILSIFTASCKEDSGDDPTALALLGLAGSGASSAEEGSESGGGSESGDLTAPANVSATGGNKTKTITVTWDDVSGADSYNIYWAESSGVTTSSGTKIEGVTSPYDHTGRTNSTDYYYIVTAVSSSGTESSASSEATAYPYLAPLKTGQTQCWDASGSVIGCAGTGQDGEYQAGRDADFTGPTEHATHAGDYTTTDNVTGLVWKTCTEGLSGADCTTGGAGTYKNDGTMGDASDQCDNLNSDNSGNGYAGRTDWRLPTIEELETIINYNTSNPAAFAAGFPATISYYYWSESTYVSYPSYGWTVGFDDGPVYGRDTTDSFGFCVRCVVGNFSQPSEYTDNSDGTVTDKGTGLIWQKCTAGQTEGSGDCQGTGSSANNYGADNAEKSWNNALDYCNSLTLAGRSWRLPNVNELKSIVDRTTDDPAIDTTAFPNTVADAYWSASTSLRDTARASYVRFGDGGGDSIGKTLSYYVRCVADGP